MTCKPFNFRAWSIGSAPLGSTRWKGWNIAGRFPRANVAKLLPLSQLESLPVYRHEHNGWVDFYLGRVRHKPKQRRSLMDSHLKVGIHYLMEDAERIIRQSSPEQIPDQLWRQLQKKLTCQP